MALVKGTNCGFVTVAPTAAPGATSANWDGYSFAGKYDSPSGATSVTELGARIGSLATSSSWEMALYSHDAGNDIPNAFVGSKAGPEALTAAGWKSFTGLSISISGSTTYWIAGQIDVIAGAATGVKDSSAGERYAQKGNAETELRNPWVAGAETDDFLWGTFAVYTEGATTYTSTASLDALIQKTGIAKTTSLDALIQISGVTKTAVIDALIQAARTKLASLDALIKKIDLTGTLSLDALIQQVKTSTASLDALLQVSGILKSLDLDALIQAARTVSTSLDAIIAAPGATITTSLDALVQAQRSVQTSLDGIIMAAMTKTLSLDALVALTTTGTLSLDALISMTTAGTLTIDALIQAVMTKGMSLDAIISDGVIIVPHEIIYATDRARRVEADGHRRRVYSTDRVKTIN